MALKNELLAVFESEREKTFSGAALAELFGVSRNAVWKAVNALKSEGYEIVSVGKSGYKLSEKTDILSEEGIRAFLPESLKSIRIFTYKQTGSTNDEAKRFVADDPNSCAVFAAERQTKGRGRYGREFYSPDTGLYMSIVFHPNLRLDRVAVFTAAAAVAAARAIEEQSGAKVGIKWVNDLYVGEKKVSGILNETLADFETGQVRSMIAGIGINVTTTVFPDELANKAASISEGGVVRNRLAASVIKNFFGLINDNESVFMDEYEKRSFLIGRDIIFSDGERQFSGKVVGIGQNCELKIETDSEVKVFSHGEIVKF